MNTTHDSLVKFDRRGCPSAMHRSKRPALVEAYAASGLSSPKFAALHRVIFQLGGGALNPWCNRCASLEEEVPASPHGDALSACEIPEMVITAPAAETVREPPAIAARGDDFARPDDDPSAGSAPIRPKGPIPPETPKSGNALVANDLKSSPGMQVAWYGYRFYDPVTGRWPSRDPICEHAFRITNAAMLNLDDSIKKNCEDFNPYLFCLNEPIISTDILGLYKFQNCDGVLSESEKEEIRLHMLEARSRLLDPGLPPSGGTYEMKKCLLYSLAEHSNLTIVCSTPICRVILIWADGYSVPGSGYVTIHPAAIKRKSPGNEMQWVTNMIIHEAVHACGKWGHEPPDNPYEWADLLTNPNYSRPN